MGISSSTNFSIASIGPHCFFGEKVGELHHPGNGRVEIQMIEVFRHRRDGFVQRAVLLVGRRDVFHRRIQFDLFAVDRK